MAAFVCTDLDECSLNNGGCDGICINSPGTYRCDCVGIAQLYTANGQFGITIPPGETGLEPWNVYYLNHTCIQTREFTLFVGDFISPVSAS